MRRSSTLNNYTASGVIQEIGSKYDNIVEAAEAFKKYEELLELDVDALIADLREATDFTGITVVAGSTSSWDPVTKVLTVSTVKGDKGDPGEDGIYGSDGADGADGVDGQVGPAGHNGRDGLTPVVEFSYDPATGNLEFEIVRYEERYIPTITTEWGDEPTPLEQGQLEWM
jgi:hypothetical protein